MVAYFPASGLRWCTDGHFYNVGTEGDSWSSSSTGIVSYWATYLRFNAVDNGTMNHHRRGYGFPVRCVQAFI